MHTRFKRFLLIFMMLALPVQAFASVALFGCELSQVGKETPNTMDSAVMNHAMPDHTMPDHTMPDHTMPDHGMPNCHDSERAPAGDHQCSHCAACYLAAAFPIPPATSTLVAPTPYTPHLQRTESFSGFIPEGPERPPRPSLA